MVDPKRERGQRIVPSRSAVREMSAKAIEEALEERILGGVYPTGGRLPSVRRLADEFGASPSTVGRSLQELQRRGWIRIANRQGAVVAPVTPANEHRQGRAKSTLRRLVLLWRLAGGTPDEFLRLTQDILEEAASLEATVAFVECNEMDLVRMSAQIREQVAVRITPVLLADARAHPERLRGRTVVVPFFHLAEVREVAAPDTELIPLNFVPSPATVQALVDLDTNSKVAAIGMDERIRRRVEGIVRQFSPAYVESAVATDTDRVDALIDRADVVVTTPATRLAPERLAAARQVVTIELVLERSGAEFANLAARAVAVGLGDSTAVQGPVERALGA